MALIDIASTGLLTTNRQLEVVGHNIANVKTPGYVRQDARIENVEIRKTGAQWFEAESAGAGVRVTSVIREYDQYLQDEVVRSATVAEGDKIRAQFSRQVAGLFGEGGSGLATAMDDLNTALADVVNDPAATAPRSVFKTRIELLADRFRSTDQQLEGIGLQVQREVDTRLDALNGRLLEVSRLNQKISQSTGLRTEALDLMNQRDYAIKEISNQLEIQAMPSEDGAISLFTPSGNALVLGPTTARITLETGHVPGDQRALTLNYGNRVARVSLESLGGGAVPSLLRFAEEDLLTARSQVGHLATAFAAAYNTAHQAGQDLNGNAGKALLQTSLQTGPRNAVMDRDNTGNGVVKFQMEPGKGADLKATDYTLDTTADGFILTPLSNGSALELDDFAQVTAELKKHGIAATITGTANAGDRFWIQSASPQAGSFKSLLASTDDLAAASAAATAMSRKADNTNALNMLSVRNARVANGQSVTDAFATMTAETGVRAGRYEAASTASSNLYKNSVNNFDARSGVNLDEEASKLLQFQQAYQATARLMGVAQSLFDTMLTATTGR